MNTQNPFSESGLSPPHITEEMRAKAQAIMEKKWKAEALASLDSAIRNNPPPKKKPKASAPPPPLTPPVDRKVLEVALRSLSRDLRAQLLAVIQHGESLGLEVR